MAQVVDPDAAPAETPEALAARGRELVAANDLEAAIENFGRVLELQCAARAARRPPPLSSLAHTPRRPARRVTAHGEEHINCAPAYVEYARTLLLKAQMAADPLGSSVPGAVPVGSSDGAGKAPGGPSGSAAEEEGEDGEEGEGEGEDGEGDDLQVAFECFEVARIMYEKARLPARRPCATGSAPTAARGVPAGAGHARAGARRGARVPGRGPDGE